MSNFHPIEVMGRGSEPQLQVDENSKITNFSGLRVLKLDLLKTL